MGGDGIDVSAGYAKFGWNPLAMEGLPIAGEPELAESALDLVMAAALVAVVALTAVLI